MPRKTRSEEPASYKTVPVTAEVYEDLSEFMHERRLRSRGAAVAEALKAAKAEA
jgi:hypothetical protein